MQKINKTDKMPVKTAKAFKKYKAESWGEIPEDIKAPLREQLYHEQEGLCCYCCQKLKYEWSHIEHVQSRKHYPNKSFEYNNLLLSCSTPKQCDNAKGNQELPLTPLMNDCEQEIRLNLAGELISTTTRGNESLEVLKLNNRKICNRRKNLVDTIIFVFDTDKYYSPPIAIQDSEILNLILAGYDDIYEKHEIEYIIKKLTT